MDENIISQFIPILIILWLLMNSTQFIEFSQTIIGKLIAVCIIIFYTIIDKKIGLFVCVLTILFYQSDFVENTLNKMNITETFNTFITSIIPPSSTQPENSMDTGLLSYFPLSLLDTLGFTDYNTIPTPPDAISEFKKRNCINNQLKYKNMNVKNEYVDLIFPELSFKNDVCNPCDKHCKFSIIESKLKNEVKLKPMQSNEILE